MCTNMLNAGECRFGVNCKWRHADTEAEEIRARAARKAGQPKRPTAAGRPKSQGPQAVTPKAMRSAEPRTTGAACSRPGIVRKNRFAPLATNDEGPQESTP